MFRQFSFSSNVGYIDFIRTVILVDVLILGTKIDFNLLLRLLLCKVIVVIDFVLYPMVFFGIGQKYHFSEKRSKISLRCAFSGDDECHGYAFLSRIRILRMGIVYKILKK